MFPTLFLLVLAVSSIWVLPCTFSYSHQADTVSLHGGLGSPCLSRGGGGCTFSHSDQADTVSQLHMSM